MQPLEYTLRLANAAFQGPLNQSRQALDAFKGAAGRVQSGLNGLNLGFAAASAGAAALAVKTANLVNDAVGAAATFDALKRGLSAVSGEGEDLATNLSRVERVAKLPGLSFKDALQGTINLRAVKFSAAESERTIKALGNALATVGRGKDDLEGVVRAFGQMISKNKVLAEELNQVAERLPQIRTAMEAAFGTSDTEVLQRMNVSASRFISGIISELEKLPKVTGGLKNELENLADETEKLQARFGAMAAPYALAWEKIKLGTAQGMTQMLAEIAAGFDAAEAKVGPWGNKLIALFQGVRAEHAKWEQSLTAGGKAEKEMEDRLKEKLADLAADTAAARAQLNALFSGTHTPDLGGISKTLGLIEELKDALAGSDEASALDRLNESIASKAGKLGVNSAADVASDPGKFSAEQIKDASELARLESQRAAMHQQMKSAAVESAKQADVERRASADATLLKRMQVQISAAMRGISLGELRVLELRAAGQDEMADKLDRELRLQQLILQYKQQLNASEVEARNLAERRLTAEEKLAKTTDGGSKKIMGYSRERQAAKGSALDWLRPHAAVNARAFAARGGDEVMKAVGEAAAKQPGAFGALQRLKQAGVKVGERFDPLFRPPGQVKAEQEAKARAEADAKKKAEQQKPKWEVVERIQDTLAKLAVA